MLVLVLHLLILIWMFTRTRIFFAASVPRWVLPLILVLKVLGGYAIARYYLNTYQGGDIHGYLADTKAFHDLFQSSPAAFFSIVFGYYDHDPATLAFLSKLNIWFDSGYGNQYNDARTVIRFHALLSMVSANNEWVHLIWSNVLSMLGMLALLRFFYSREGRESAIPWAALFIFFLPNVFIWTSAILKEPLLVFAMGMTLRYFQLWNQQRRAGYFAIMVFFVLCFLLVKSFWLLAFLPGLLAWYLFPRMKNAVRTITLAYACLTALLLLGGLFIPAINVPELLFGQQRNMWRFAVYMHSGSLVHPVSFAPDPLSFLKHLPEAFAYGMFQPWPWQLAHWYYFPLFLENLIFPCLLIPAVLRYRKNSTPACPETVLAFIAGAVIVVVSAYTTPVIGSLIRYRMPGLVLMLLALFRYLLPAEQRRETTEHLEA
ncbi:MAG: hypothetical protein JNL88_13275 [Bacteroidia bacterium]|nr:hypothetical protein [Bacteroidia bacterium]